MSKNKTYYAEAEKLQQAREEARIDALREAAKIVMDLCKTEELKDHKSALIKAANAIKAQA